MNVLFIPGDNVDRLKPQSYSEKFRKQKANGEPLE